MVFVEYLFMDKYGSSSKTVEIDHNDPTMVDLMEGAVGFRFCEIVVDSQPKEIDGVVIHTDISQKRSNWYFDGIKMTVDEVIEQYGSDPKYAQLVRNIKQQNVNCICVTPSGNFIKMNDEDILISDINPKKVK